MTRLKPLTLLLFLVVACSGAADAEPLNHIFKSGSEGYHTFRIPSLITTKSGALLAFCEGRVTGAGDSGDIDLVMKRSEDGGKTWGPLVVLWNDGTNTCGNPCPVVVSETGDIVMLLTWNHETHSQGKLRKGEPDPNGGRVPYLTRSTDDGRTWSPPVEISESVDREDWHWYATGPGVAIEIQNGPHKGRLVAPANHSYYREEDGAYEDDAQALYSDDQGRTWKISDTFISPGANESTVVELSDGRLMFNTRMQSHKEGKRGIAFSSDGGVKWTGFHHDPNLTCPTCQASLIRYDEDTLLFSNPQGKGRAGMTIQASKDDGKTWPYRLLVHEGSSAYSQLAVLKDGRVGLVYEASDEGGYSRGGVAFRTFGIDEIVR